MLNSIIIAVVAVSAVWVYLDATKNKIGKIPDGKGMFNMSAGAWCAVTLGLWIIGFPAYLINRGDMIEKTKETPIVLKVVAGKPLYCQLLEDFGFLCLLVVLLFLLFPVVMVHIQNPLLVKLSMTYRF